MLILNRCFILLLFCAKVTSLAEIISWKTLGEVISFDEIFPTINCPSTDNGPLNISFQRFLSQESLEPRIAEIHKIKLQFLVLKNLLHIHRHCRPSKLQRVTVTKSMHLSQYIITHASHRTSRSRFVMPGLFKTPPCLSRKHCSRSIASTGRT